MNTGWIWRMLTAMRRLLSFLRLCQYSSRTPDLESDPFQEEEGEQAMLARNLLAAALLLLSGAWGSALAQRPASGARNGDDIHAQFQAAFSSGNAAAAADNLRRERRPRHAGRHRRREAIRKQIEAAMKAGLSDLAGDILLSRPLGKMTLRVGEWHAKWRGRPLHGFFTAILTYENGGVKMLEETTNVAPQ